MSGKPHSALSAAASFILLTGLLSSLFYALVIASGHLSGGGGTYVAGLMWCPAVAALITARLSGLTLTGFAWPGKKWMILAVLVPLAYSLLAYASIWLGGGGGFPNGQFVADKREALGLASLDDVGVIVLWFLLLSFAGILQATARALGEEIGWRGFLTPLLVDRLGFAGAILVTGTVWTLWHIPILVFADYHSASPLPVAIFSFTLLIFAMSTILAWLRMRSASVWPCAVMHAAHNAFIQGFFTPATAETGPWTSWLVDEFGLATPVAIAVFAVVILAVEWRRKADAR
jgi:membrane protease YdiL (CAAX protease family)